MPQDTRISRKKEPFEGVSEEVIYLLPKLVSYRDALWTTDNLYGIRLKSDLLRIK